MQHKIIENSNILIDPFKQRWVPRIDFTAQALTKHLEKDASLFAAYVIGEINTIHRQNPEKTTFVINNAEDNSSNPALLDSLVKAISKQSDQISPNICIEVNGEKLVNCKSLQPQLNQNTIPHTINLSDLFDLYSKIENAVEIKSLSLEEQINVLTTASNHQSQELPDWQDCLNKLLKDAGDNKNKRGDVKRYVQATQAILTDPSNTQTFENILTELSVKAERDAMIKGIVEKGVLFLLAITFGALLVVTAAINPLLTLGIFAVALGLVVANFYNTTNNEGRLSIGISHILGKMGLFQFTEPAEKAQQLLDIVKQPDSNSQIDPPLPLSPIYT